MTGMETACVLSQEQIAEAIFSLVLKVSFAKDVRAGQFVSLFSKDGAHLLPRPISVCGSDGERGTIRLVYRCVGSGTAEFSRLKEGDSVKILGPQGNGFPTELAAGKNVLLVGGGIGIPPMMSAAAEMRGAEKQAQPESVTFAVGYRSDDTYLLEELKSFGQVLISTDDGSLGVRGTVMDAVRKKDPHADLIFACGPKPMLRAVKDYAENKGIPCWISLEERMACGVGVCLGCVAKTTVTDEHSLVKNRRVCKDGPVFNAKEADLT